MKIIAILSLLLLQSLHLGLLSTSMMYRYDGKVQLVQKDGHYELQFCTATCLADTNPTVHTSPCNNTLNMCSMCNNSVEDILKTHNNSCNMMMTFPTSSNSAISSPTITPTSCTATVTQTALGAMVAILTALLAIVSTGWVCTCWAMKKRRRAMNINTTSIR